ncbi:MAG: hypothetical protein JEY94_14665 [Melioribacteraceae bacterium]|nr:hypothetical protein [Melioribacteraceae bacterium]
MDFLDSLVIPQSPDNLILIKFLLGLSWLLLIPFVSVLLGITTYSIYMNRKGISEDDQLIISVSNSIIEIITKHKIAWFVLGIIPLLSIGFSYVQLLQGLATGISLYIVVALFLFIDCTILIFAYQYAFKLKGLFDKVDSGMFNTDGVDEDSKRDIGDYRKRLGSLYSTASKIGVICLIITVYLLAVVIDVSYNTSSWNGASLLNKMFSLGIIFNFIQFISAAFAAGSIVVLYYFYRNNSNYKIENAEAANTVRNYSLVISIVFLLVQPILIVLKIMVLPHAALSYHVFLLGVINLSVVFLLVHLVYRMLQDRSLNYSSSLLFVLIFFFTFTVLGDQISFATAAKKQDNVLQKEYEAYAVELDKKLGLGEIVVNGEEVYTRVCSACHQFDKVVVGPAHKDVLPKYEGKMDDLVAYILDPVKVDPKFTVMPKQAINKEEAEAVAAHLMELYNSKK